MRLRSCPLMFPHGNRKSTMSKNTAKPHSANHFATVPNVSVPRSRFDLSHGYKTTFDGNYLIPVMVSHLLPGDSWRCTIKELTRMTTPICPFMDNVRITFHAFAVPNRLVWDNWEDYITGCHKGKLGTTHTQRPQITLEPEDCLPGKLANYFGIRCSSGEISVDALPFRAHNLVWNEWYRDENLQSEAQVPTGDSGDMPNMYTVFRRGKRKDYFTSALPWVQKGPDVSLPIGGHAPLAGQLSTVASDNVYNAFSNSGGQPVFHKGTSVSGAVLPQNTPITLDGSNAYADLSEATAATINSLREAFAIQHVFERDARNGSRYVESLKAHWGVTCPDFRLQRPEYIGGGSVDFMVNSVAQTSASTSDTPQGNLAAVAKSAGAVGFQYSAVEHGVLLVYACVTSDITYQQGTNRLWFNRSRFDEFFPEFAHLGEQPIYEKELFTTGIPEQDESVFGYQERYAEYRYFPSLITGKMNSTSEHSLDYWHLAQVFETPPSLSADFIMENTPFERVLAVQDEPQFYSDMWFDCKVIRPLPVYSVPSMLDHF
nr:MAG: major capsid protein [Microviridae sp.]